MWLGGGAATDFWLEFARALCRHYMHCPGEPYGGEELTVTLNGDEERCAEALADDLVTRHPSITSLNAGVASGVFTIQAASVEACLTATARCAPASWNRPTDELRFQDITPCREVFEGSVAESGDCERDEDCAGDSRCGGSGCNGTCAPRLTSATDTAETGGMCEEDRDCAGSISDNHWPTCYTRERECVERWVISNQGPAEDDPCTGGGIYDISLCIDDLYCSADSVCEVPEPAGTPCDALTACLDGVCVMGSCAELVIRRTEGEPCDGQAVVCDAFAGLVCSGSSCTAVATSPDFGCDTPSPWFRKMHCPPLSQACDGDSRD